MTLRKTRVAVDDRRGALAAARYLLDEGSSPRAFSDPGDGPERANAVWAGSQAAADLLGLEVGTEVQLEQLASALRGQHSITGEQVRRPGTVDAVDKQGRKRLDANGEPYKEQVVNSFDLTSSPPKSWSVLWSQADAELKAELEQAVIDAAYEAIEYVIKTRPVVGGEARAQGFIAALTLHVTARTASGEEVPSPQLHVHGELVGVLDGEGKLRTPNSAALYKNSAMRVAGAVVRLKLAQKAEELGFRTEAGTGRGGRYFEISGVSKALCERMSGRTKDVLAWVRKHGVVDKREAARAAAATRTAKSQMPAERVRDWWRHQASECEWGPAQVAEIRDLPAVERDVAALQQRVHDTVLAELWAEGPVISVGAVEATAIEVAAHGLTREQALAVVAEMQASGELIVLEDWLVTSRDIHEMETEVASVALEAAGRPRTPLSRKAVDAGIEVAKQSLGGHDLFPDQAAAVRQLTTGAEWAYLTGQAGTGKGPVLEAVAEAHRREGWKVVGCAVDNTTSRGLAAQLSVKGGEEALALTIEKMMRRLDKGKVPLDEHTLIVIEEASKIGLKDWKRVAQVIAATRARVLIVGDVGQAQAIECPGMLDFMLDNEAIPGATLEKVLRHRDPDYPDDPTKLHPWMAKYQTALYQGRPMDAIMWLRQNDAITMHATRDAAIFGLVDLWEKRRYRHDIDVRDSILVVYGSNEDVNIVNQYAQERRIEAREIGGDSVRAIDRGYRLYAGDVVMLREGAYEPEQDDEGSKWPRWVENGTLGVIEEVDARLEQVIVAFEEPTGTRRVLVDIGALRAEFEAKDKGEGADQRPTPSLHLSYAGHPFPLQGRTWDYVGSLWGHWTQRKELTYGGDTRGKFWLDVHTDLESIGSDIHTELGGDEREDTVEAAYARQARKLEEDSHRLASIMYDETPDASIVPPTPELGSAPRLPLRKPEFQAGMQVSSRPDLLQEVEELLGPEPAARIAGRAEALAEVAAGLEIETLQLASDQGREAIDRLDGGAVLEAGRIANGRDKVSERIEAALAHAAALDAEAAELPGLRNRRRRNELKQEADANRSAVEHERRTLARLLKREGELQEDREKCLAENGEALARAYAAEKVLAERGELVARETAVRDPELAVAGAEQSGPSMEA